MIPNRMIPVNGTTLRGLIPGKPIAKQNYITEAIGSILANTLDKYAINTRSRIACFLAQICYESDYFKATEEYASGSAYEGRVDLGNVRQGDGMRYKGRGLIEITGRKNYTAMGAALGLDLVNYPELASTFGNSLLIACEYWKAHALNLLADKKDVVAITRAVQGGSRGLKDRAALTSKATALISALQAATLDGAPGVTDEHPVLYRGCDNVDGVETLQRQLTRWLTNHLAIDGDFGAATEMAVMDFQEINGLAIDGIVGPATWTELMRKTAR